MGARSNAAGLGIGSFFSAFTSARNDKELRAERDKAAKLSGQLLEIQLKQLQEREAAFERLDERINPLNEFEPAPSKFTEGGREIKQLESAPGPGLAELISDPSALFDLVRSGQLNIGDLIKEQGIAGRADQRQGNLDKFLGSGFTNPTDAANNPQFIFAPGIGANGEITVTPSLNPAYQLPQTEQLEKNEITTAFNRTQKSIQMNMQLAQGQPLQATGSPFASAGSLFGRGSEAVSGLFGVENPFADAAKGAAMQKALEKDFAVAMFTSAELDILLKEGRITLAQWNQLKSSNPDLNNHWAVNAKIQLDSLELKLNNNDVLGINVSNEKEVRDYIDAMREVIGPELELLDGQQGDIASQVGGFAGKAVDAASEFARHTLKEIEALNLDDKTAAQIAAIRVRYDELKKRKNAK